MSNDGIQIRLGDLIYILRKRWKLIVLYTFLGLLLGGMATAVSFLQGKSMNYEVDASFAITPKTSNGIYSDHSKTMTFNDYTIGQEMVNAVSYVIKSDRNLQRVAKTSGLPSANAKIIKENLSLSQYGETQIIEMKLMWNSKSEGKTLAKALIASTKTLLPKTLEIGDVTVINQPSVSYVPRGTKSYWAMFTILGFLGSFLFVVLELVFRPTLINERDMESVLELPKIAEIPKTEDLLGETPFIRNRFDMVANLVSLSGRKCILVTSAMEKEGKSTVASNLAISLNQLGKKVLLLDFDFFSQGISEFWNLRDSVHTLNALYLGEIQAKDAPIQVAPNLDVLPSLADASSFHPILFSVIEKLGKDYDHVIIDAPSISESAMVLQLGAKVDGTIFVVKFDGLPIVTLQSAIDQLDKAGVNLLGGILNQVPEGKKRILKKKGKKPKKARDPLKDLSEEGDEEDAKNI